MPQWEFDEVSASSVRKEVTQGDQFNNDEVGLAEALVREAIQNSSDAALDGQVAKVRFTVRTISGPVRDRLVEQMDTLLPHLDACDVDLSPLDREVIRILTIEDFNTRGLMGKRDDVDKGDFDRFWRAVGDSGKKGKAGGRWGLGKLVYSSASRLKLFYGLTVSADDPQACLLGQAVLENHRIADKFYPTHGFYLDGRLDPLGLQAPLRDPAELAYFRTLGGLVRAGQSGLSIIIPWLLDGIEEESIIAGVVANYYFPILAGKLVVEVGNVVIDRQNFLEIAAAQESLHHIPFDFVKKISDALDSGTAILAGKALREDPVDEGFFTEEQTALMKENFASGGLVHARIPVVLKPRDGDDTTSHLDLFLKALPENETPFALIARGPIILPGERRYFGASAAYGGMVANDDGIADFLGDAENPAHTAWNTKANKLEQRWRSPVKKLAAIRKSLRAFYALIADQEEKEDAEALIDIFSILDETQSASGRKRKSRKPKVDVPAREKAITISRRDGGFSVSGAPGAASWEFPKAIRVRVAYDMVGANPFKRHSPFDFDLTKQDGIIIEAANASVEAQKPNVLKVMANSADFDITLTGFDSHRDVVVDARAL